MIKWEMIFIVPLVLVAVPFGFILTILFGITLGVELFFALLAGRTKKEVFRSWYTKY